MSRFVSVAVLLVGLGLAGSPAWAEKVDKDEVKRVYKEGTKYFSLGNFPKAIELYTQAFELKPDPVFLFNIAQCHRLAGDLPQAAFFYKSYLRSAPEAPNRVEVEGRIHDIENTLAQREPSKVEPPLPAAKTEPAPKPVEPTAAVPAPVPETTVAQEPKVVSPDPALSRLLPSEPTLTPEPAPQAALDLKATPGVPETKPLVRQWWFWSGVGAVAVAAVTVGVLASRSSGTSAPSGDYPMQPVF